MPAARHFSRSSLKTLAVMAIIGMVFASGRSSARIAFAAYRPSISGIITSMRMASKLPGPESRKAASACLPLHTAVVQQEDRNLHVELIILGNEQPRAGNI